MKIQFDMPPASAQQSNGVAVKYAAAKRNVPRWRWYLLLALVILPPAYFAFRFAMAFWWETAPALVQVERAVVRAGVAGWVSTAPTEGDRIEIRGFGSFSLRFRPPRLGRNPKTGDSVALPGKYVPHFKPGKELRDRVNNGDAPSH